jgi:hypothetical protein
MTIPNRLSLDDLPTLPVGEIAALMAISLASLQTSTALRPPRALIHGVASIGQSTFAASADARVFVLTCGTG